jgi:hypothetical protein
MQMTRLAEVAGMWAVQLALGGHVYYLEGQLEDRVATTMLIAAAGTASQIDWERQSKVWQRLVWIPLVSLPSLAVGLLLNWDMAVFTVLLMYVVYVPDWSLLRERFFPRKVRE